MRARHVMQKKQGRLRKTTISSRVRCKLNVACLLLIRAKCFFVYPDARAVRRQFFFLLLAIPALLRPVDAASTLTGNELQELCVSVGSFDECVSFLKDVNDSAKASALKTTPNSQRPLGSCGPDKGIDTVPLAIAWRLAWEQYANKYPHRLSNSADDEVLLAFEEQWPCKR